MALSDSNETKLCRSSRGVHARAFKGAPRRAGPFRPWPIPRTSRDALQEFVRRREVGCQELREAAGLLGDFGAAACPRPMGGSPPATGATAAPLPRIRRQAVPAATVPHRRARADGRAVLRSPGSLLPVKDHHQGRAWRRVADAMAQAPPLTLIFPGKTSAPIGRTGGE